MKIFIWKVIKNLSEFSLSRRAKSKDSRFITFRTVSVILLDS